MKNFQQNLLVALALGLCVLCAYQWYAQTIERNRIQGLNQLVFEKTVAIRDDTNTIATLNHQIEQMDAHLTELAGAVKTNEQLAAVQKREINRLQAAGEGLTNRIAEFQSAVDTLEAKLKAAYDGIRKQNESLQELVAQRGELVNKYNDSVKDRNDIVAKYNELAAQAGKQRSGAGKP